MNSLLIKTIFSSFILLALSLVLLGSMLEGNVSPLMFVTGVCLFFVLMLKGPFGLCLAIATTSPFLVSLPFARGIPAIALALLVCGLACFLRKGVSSTNEPPALKAYDIWVVIFYVYLIARYAVNPVKPGYALGMGQDMTGFRSWFDHFIGLSTMLLSGFLLNSKARMASFFKVYLYSSLGFALALIVVMFISHQGLSQWLENSGVFIAYFNNGWRRFVVLPYLGLVLVAAGLLPVLFPLRLFWRITVFGLGIFSIIAGGNRSSFISLLILMVVVLLMKRNYVFLWCSISIIFFSVLSVKVLNENHVIVSDSPFVRVFGLFNQDINEDSGGTSTAEWRLQRWKRAWIDIGEHPFFGMGYSGIKGYFSLISDYRYNSSDLDMDRDLASGSTHNGYLSAARALGIPVTLVFIFLLTRQIVRHFRAALSARKQELAQFELHLYLFVSLLIIGVTLGISGEIRQPGIWMFLAVSLLVFQLEAAGQRQVKAGASVES